MKVALWSLIEAGVGIVPESRLAKILWYDYWVKERLLPCACLYSIL